MPISEARKRANKKWNAKNKEKMQRVAKKSTTKNYIFNSNLEELKQVKAWIEEQEKKLKTENI